MKKINIFTIILLMSTICSAQTSILTYDVNGVTRLHARLNAPAIDIPIPTVNPPDAMYIGIPAPFAIGDYNAIDITYRIYDSNALQVAARVITPAMAYYPSDSGGYYTHYVDANADGATDSSNDYGTKAKPRKTIPYTGLPAGSIVEVHGKASFASQYNLVVNGTESLPVFIRGVDNPLMTNGSIIKGSYAVIDGLYFYNKNLELRPHNSSNAHHISIKNCTFLGIGVVAGSQSVIPIAGESVSNVFHNIVVYNNEISYYGQFDAEVENDYHGVIVGGFTYNTWVLDNHIHHMGGDSIQVSGGNRSACRVYIAGNDFHENFENGVDLKDCNDVIVSQNEIYNFNSAVNEGPIVIHYNSGTGALGSNNVWCLFNTLHDVSSYAIQTSSKPENTYIIGNLVYNTGGTAFVSWGIGDIYYIANTTHNTVNGLYAKGTSVSTLSVINNIFGTLSSGTYNELENTDYTNNAVITGNLYAQAFSGDKEGTNSVIADPLFVDADANDFDLQSESPFKSIEESSAIQTVIDRFNALYGIDISDEVRSLRVSGVQKAP